MSFTIYVLAGLDINISETMTKELEIYIKFRTQVYMQSFNPEYILTKICIVYPHFIS